MCLLACKSGRTVVIVVLHCYVVDPRLRAYLALVHGLHVCVPACLPALLRQQLHVVALFHPHTLALPAAPPSHPHSFAPLLTSPPFLSPPQSPPLQSHLPFRFAPPLSRLQSPSHMQTLPCTLTSARNMSDIVVHQFVDRSLVASPFHARFPRPFNPALTHPPRHPPPTFLRPQHGGHCGAPVR